MAVSSRLKRHAELVEKMAETLGIDLAEQEMRGTLPAEELDTVVLNCVSCKDPDGCEAWIAEHKDGTAETPEFCRNKALFESLAGRE